MKSRYSAPLILYLSYAIVVKILDGLINDFSKRFQHFVDTIRDHAARIETLAQRGYTTVLLDSKATLDKTAEG